MKKLFSLILVIILSISITSCELFDSTTTTTETETQETSFNYIISTKNPYIDLYAGETAVLDFTTNFTLEDGERLEYTSSNADVVRVISTGYIIAKGKGTANVVVSYKTASLTYIVTVSQDTELEQPTKLTYYIGEELDLTGAHILYYNNDKTIAKKVDITNDMVDRVDMSTKGEKVVVVRSDDEMYTFTITVLEREFEPYLIKEVNISNESIKANDTVNFSIIHNKISSLKKEVSSVYDYQEYKIEIDIESPSGKNDTIYAFYTQDFNETRKNVSSMSSGRNLEGYVFSKTGKNYQITFTKVNNPYFAARYVPTEEGTYTYTVKSYRLDSTLIETLDGEFRVSGTSKSDGVIKVSSNKKTFEFESGKTYMPVGENVAWYTSAERRYGDYEIIFDSLKENNANYARVWMSAFSFSLFWKDVENYDERLDEAYELDKVFEMAEDDGIYIDLTIFHHGMFSARTNPMWPNTVNDWYVNKYGANPYSKVLSSPGEFFTSTYGKKWCKNYLTYIVARWGYSDALMSYELFNEVDWVEEYDATTGALWHDEMATHIKSLDFRDHMVTTSVKGDNFSSDIYKVFSLNSMDYVNVHNYGSYNYLLTIPSKVQTAYAKFNKPVMYQEVGYSGNGGDDQRKKDPNDITLHQELWAGIMASGSSGMNWWWDSWIEKYNAYSPFSGPAKYAALMDLSGDNMSLAYDSSKISNSQSGLYTLGYLFPEKAYLYVFSKNYNVDNTNVTISSNLSITSLNSGTYTVEFYDTNTGQKLKTETISTNLLGSLKVPLSSKNDIALIIYKNS